MYIQARLNKALPRLDVCRYTDLVWPWFGLVYRQRQTASCVLVRIIAAHGKSGTIRPAAATGLAAAHRLRQLPAIEKKKHVQISGPGASSQGYAADVARHPSTQHLAAIKNGHRSGARFAVMLAAQAYIFRRYCPPTSNSALVIWPSEQTRTASIRRANTFSLAMAACCSSASAFGAASLWR